MHNIYTLAKTQNSTNVADKRTFPTKTPKYLDICKVLGKANNRFSTIFHGGPKEVQNYMLKGQIKNNFLGLFYISYFFQMTKLNWLVGQIWLIGCLLGNP